MDAAQIERLIRAELPAAEVTVFGDDGQHFEARVIAAEFEGLSKVARHRLVYQALGNTISSGELHALSLRTQSPGEATEMPVQPDDR